MDYAQDGLAAQTQKQSAVSGQYLGNTKALAPHGAISDRLRSIENAADELAARTDRLAYRLAGPTSDAQLTGMSAINQPAEDRPLPRLLDAIESALRKIERNVERASEAT